MQESTKGKRARRVADSASPSVSDGPSSVLASLPRSRPQQSSARRAAARASTANGEANLLGGLPRARPQHLSPRRDAARAQRARAAASAATAEAPTTTPARKGGAAARPARSQRPRAGKAAASGTQAPRRTRRSPARSRKGAEEAIPRQGFAVEPELPGGAIDPPGSAELLASAGELAGELARVGVRRGARLLKDFVVRLPG